MSPRSASVWCALLVNASTRRLVLASATPTRRVQPAAFLSTSGIGGTHGGGGKPTASTGSRAAITTDASRSFLSAAAVRGERRPAVSELLMGPCSPSYSWCGGGACRSSSGLAQHQPQPHPRRGSRARRQLRRGSHVRRATTAGSRLAAMSTAAGTESEAPMPMSSADGGRRSGSEEAMRVTLLSGFLGAGKTTLMRNVLRQAREERLSLAVIVNDMADVNIDAQLLGRGGAPEAGGLGQAGQDVRSMRSSDNSASVAMQDGCICCTLRDDLLLEVEAIAREGKHRHLIIESTGISDPNPVAEALATSDNSSDGGSSHFHADADGERDEHAASGREEKGGLFSLDTLVTVVDSTSFLDEVRKADDLEDRGLEAEEGDTRTIADLLVSQVEFANVILLNKADLATPADMATLEALVRRLNPAARIVRTVSSDVGLSEVLGTGEFDLDEASQAAGWLQALNDEEPETPAAHSHTCGKKADDDDDGADGQGVPDGDCPGCSACADDRGPEHVAEEKGCGDDACRDPGCCPPGEDDHGDHDHHHVHSGSGGTAAAAASSSRPAETFGIGSFTFRARRPFHPERLMGFVMGHMPSVLRSKGFLWLATRHGSVGVWNQAGGSFATEYGGSWDGDEDSDDSSADDDVDGRRREAEPWDAQGQASRADGAVEGDDDGSNIRRNELVFIGLGMDEDALKGELRRCLLSEEEMAGGPEGWNRQLSDPFPPWE
ncbi:unnamed protein product [Scytosiphon promiscuus]